MNKFNTIYRKSYQFALSRMAGNKLIDQRAFDTSAVQFQRLVYQTFKQDYQMLAGVSVDRNAWEFDQNVNKTIHNGKESLKVLCQSYYYNQPFFVN